MQQQRRALLQEINNSKADFEQRFNEIEEEARMKCKEFETGILQEKQKHVKEIDQIKELHNDVLLKLQVRVWVFKGVLEA